RSAGGGIVTVRAFDVLNPDIPVGDWVETAFEWFEDTFKPVLDLIKAVLETVDDTLVDALQAPPFWVLVLAFALIGGLVRSWTFVAFVAPAFYLISAVG